MITTNNKNKINKIKVEGEEQEEGDLGKAKKHPKAGSVQEASTVQTGRWAPLP